MRYARLIVTFGKPEDEKRSKLYDEIYYAEYALRMWYKYKLVYKALPYTRVDGSFLPPP